MCFNKLQIPEGLQVHKVTLDESESCTLLHEHLQMLISLHSGGLSHLEMVFSPSLFPPTQQWLRERSQALFEPPYLCIQVHLCFWFVNSFLTRSFPVLNPFSNMWHAGRKMGNFLWYMQMTCSLNTSQWLRIPQSKALTATFTSAKYECQFWTLSSTLLGEIHILTIQI